MTREELEKAIDAKKKELDALLNQYEESSKSTVSLEITGSKRKEKILVELPAEEENDFINFLIHKINMDLQAKECLNEIDNTLNRLFNNFVHGK